MVYTIANDPANWIINDQRVEHPEARKFQEPWRELWAEKKRLSEGIQRTILDPKHEKDLADYRKRLDETETRLAEMEQQIKVLHNQTLEERYQSWLEVKRALEFELLEAKQSVDDYRDSVLDDPAVQRKMLNQALVGGLGQEPLMSFEQQKELKRLEGICSEIERKISPVRTNLWYLESALEKQQKEAEREKQIAQINPAIEKFNKQLEKFREAVEVLSEQAKLLGLGAESLELPQRASFDEKTSSVKFHK